MWLGAPGEADFFSVKPRVCILLRSDPVNVATDLEKFQQKNLTCVFRSTEKFSMNKKMAVACELSVEF